MHNPTDGKKAEKMTIVYEQMDTPDMEERIALAYDLLDLDYGLTDLKIDLPEINYGLKDIDYGLDNTKDLPRIDNKTYGN